MITWIIVAGFALTTIAGPFLFPSASILLFQITLVAFAFYHGYKRYGLRAILVFFFISEIVTNLLENTSIATGFPFGKYFYSNIGVPFILKVPITIGLIYFSVGYISWCVASILLDHADRRLDGKIYLIGLPVVAAFIMTMWDLVMDPINSTIGHAWIWTHGGSYFGVPLSNFFGWFITVFIFYQLFALYLRKKSAPGISRPHQYHYQALAMYVLVGFDSVVAVLDTHTKGILDRSGFLWRQGDIYKSTALIYIFTMVFVAIITTMRLLSHQKENRPL